MQPKTQDQEQDQQAETFIGVADKVMRCLVTGGKDSHQLVLDTGMDAVEVAKAIHYLREKVNPPFIETSEINDGINNRRIIRHYLTEDGRRNLPPPVVPKWKAPDVDPRSEKVVLGKIQEALDNTKKNSFAGLKHVTGMQGKVRIDHEGRIQLSGTKGLILEAIRDKPKISTEELVEVTRLPKPIVWSTCAELVKRGLIEIIKDGTANLYREVGAPAKPVPPPKPEPAKQVIAAPVPEPVYKPADSLTQAVRALLDKHDATDLLLALVSELDSDLKLMKEFKNRMQSLTTGEKK